MILRNYSAYHPSIWSAQRACRGVLKTLLRKNDRLFTNNANTPANTHPHHPRQKEKINNDEENDNGDDASIKSSRQIHIIEIYYNHQSKKMEDTYMHLLQRKTLGNLRLPKSRVP